MFRDLPPQHSPRVASRRDLPLAGCVDAGLKVSGSKGDLVERMIHWHAQLSTTLHPAQPKRERDPLPTSQPGNPQSFIAEDIHMRAHTDPMVDNPPPLVFQALERDVVEPV
jgi:hypothetical protein